MVPSSEFVSLTKYPTQSDRVGTEIEISYKDMKHYLYRPEEEEYPVNKFDYPYYRTEKFLVLRDDIDGPQRTIAVNKDYSIIIVKTRSEIWIYPVQLSEYIGVEVNNYYNGNSMPISATTLRVDDGEPCFSVLSEVIAGKLRFVLGDECLSMLPDDFEKVHKTQEEIMEIRKNIIEGGIPIWN